MRLLQPEILDLYILTGIFAISAIDVLYIYISDCIDARILSMIMLVVLLCG